MLSRRAMLLAPLAAPLAFRLNAADRLSCFGLNWSVPLLADWKVETLDGVETLQMVTARPQQKDPRRPFQFALAETAPFKKVTLEAEVRRQGTAKSKSLILVYAWRDPAHFNYAHLSGDTATEAQVHNGIFHCFGGDRVRISSDKGPCGLPTASWHQVRLTWDGSTGMVEVQVDGQPNPSLRAADLSLTAGRVGLGSFFDTADFRNVRITGEPA